MIENPKVSILVITYNQEKYIEQTLESLITQDYKNLEIIVSDDSSKDATPEIIKSYADKYPQIVPVLNRENKGITENSNIGLGYCTGDYLCYMGGDDYLYPSKISTQVNYLLENPDVDLCGHNLDLVDEEGNKIGLYDKRNISGSGSFKWIEKGMLYGCMSILLKTNGEKLILDDRLKYSADLKFIIDYLKEGKKFEYIPEVLGAYRKSAQSITASKWDECVADSEKMFSFLKLEYSEVYQKSIKIGYDYLVKYGRALKKLESGNKKEAFRGFIDVMLSSPTIYKVYYRIVQTILS